MSRPAIWITGPRKWFLNWYRDFIATTSLHPSSSPTTLTSPNAVTACCGCTRAGPRRCHPVRLRIRVSVEGHFRLVCHLAGFRFCPAQHVALVTEGAAEVKGFFLEVT